MTLEELISHIEESQSAASDSAVSDFERQLSVDLPAAYRNFLLRCNGGHVGGMLWFSGVRPDGEIGGPGIQTLFGLRPDDRASLSRHRDIYHGNPLRIPRELLVIGDDPFGDPICLGISGPYRDQVFFADLSKEPFPELWDGQVESAGNLDLVATSFTDFIDGLEPIDEAIQNPLR